MAGKNYSANVCADTLWRIMVSKSELLDTIIYMDLLEHMMVAEKKLPAALCRKIIKAKKIMKIRLKFGGWRNKQEVFYILMIVLRVL